MTTNLSIALFALDLLLVLGFTMRLTRFALTDDLGEWLFRRPAYRLLLGHPNARVHPPYSNWREKAASGLDCPFCIGFWIGVAVLVSLALVGGPADLSEAAVWWRWIAGAFTLNLVAAHVGARLGDAGYDEE